MAELQLPLIRQRAAVWQPQAGFTQPEAEQQPVNAETFRLQFQAGAFNAWLLPELQGVTPEWIIQGQGCGSICRHDSVTASQFT